MGTDWGSANVVFGEGRIGEIFAKVGGNIQTKPEDTIQFTEVGLAIQHGNDPAENLTLMPWENIAFIRTWLTEAGKREKKRREMEREINASRPLIDVAAAEEHLRKRGLPRGTDSS